MRDCNAQKYCYQVDDIILLSDSGLYTPWLLWKKNTMKPKFFAPHLPHEINRISESSCKKLVHKNVHFQDFKARHLIRMWYSPYQISSIWSSGKISILLSSGDTTVFDSAAGLVSVTGTSCTAFPGSLRCWCCLSGVLSLLWFTLFKLARVDGEQLCGGNTIALMDGGR